MKKPATLIKCTNSSYIHTFYFVFIVYRFTYALKKCLVTNIATICYFKNLWTLTKTLILLTCFIF